MPATCSRPPDSATPSTSTTSSGTTTRSIATSTRPASCPPAPTSPGGRRRTGARTLAAGRSATGPRRHRHAQRRSCPASTRRSPPDRVGPRKLYRLARVSYQDLVCGYGTGMDSAWGRDRMSLYQEVADRRSHVTPDAYRAMQVLLYAVSLFLVVVTSLYAYA